MIDSFPKSQSQQNLILIRGLPGSGKSTLAKQISLATCADHYEADQWFVSSETGEYIFVPEQLTAAHTMCQHRTKEALSKGKDVIVSNTFVKLWEMKSYLDMAKYYEVSVVILTCKGQYRNIHNVPENVIARMNLNWENTGNNFNQF